MRVAWDLQAVTGPGRTGLGVSVQFMLDALIAHSPGVEVAGLRPNEQEQPLRGVLDRICWEQWRYPRRLNSEVRLQGLELAYSPALGAPLRSPVPVVAHVHDVIPLIYPQQFSGLAKWYWQKLLPRTWRQCRALTVSNQTVAEDIADRLGYPVDRIHVVPYYPDPAVRRTAESLRPGVAVAELWQPADKPLFVMLASHEPRKNIELAIQALGRLKAGGGSAQLVCIGGHTPHTARLRELASEQGVAGEVEFPGYLEREQAVSLLLKATALLFVSRYEGYGMPPLEAMSIGTPVVLSDIPCHRKIYGDSLLLTAEAGQDLPLPPFVGVDDAAGLATVLRQMVGDPSWLELLHCSGLAYSSQFTPEATATGLTAAFKAALAG